MGDRVCCCFFASVFSFFFSRKPYHWNRFFYSASPILSPIAYGQSWLNKATHRSCVIGRFLLRECVKTKRNLREWVKWLPCVMRDVKVNFSCVISWNDPFSTQYLRYCVRTKFSSHCVNAWKQNKSARLRYWVPLGGLLIDVLSLLAHAVVIIFDFPTMDFLL